MPGETLADLERTLALFGGELTPGSHLEGPHVNVRELRARLLGLPWTCWPDRPGEDVGSLVDVACSVLEDASWPETARDGGAAARTRGCLPLGLLSASVADVPPGFRWPERFRANLVRDVLSSGLTAWGRIHPDPDYGAVLTSLAALARQGGTSALPALRETLRAAFAWHPAGAVILERKDVRETAVLPLLVATRRLHLATGADAWGEDVPGRGGVASLALVPRDVAPVCKAALTLVGSGPDVAAVHGAAVRALVAAVAA